MMDRKAILESIKENGLYETIARDYYLIDKNDLVDMLKELDYAIYQTSYRQNIYSTILDNFMENLTETWEERM